MQQQACKAQIDLHQHDVLRARAYRSLGVRTDTEACSWQREREREREGESNCMRERQRGIERVRERERERGSPTACDFKAYRRVMDGRMNTERVFAATQAMPIAARDC